MFKVNFNFIIDYKTCRFEGLFFIIFKQMQLKKNLVNLKYKVAFTPHRSL